MCQELYNEKYYESHLGPEYIRNNGWEEVFGRIADRIIKEFQPKTVLDAGCAIGFLVEALRDRGVEAYGIDISEYAISKVRDDIKPYCKVASITEPLQNKYDLIVCIEVFEHLEMDQIKAACTNLCSSTKEILFSSTPFDYHEESHINVRPIEFWVELFSYEGYYHEIEYDTSYIAIQALRFRKGERDRIQLVRAYEHSLFSLRQELVALRDSQNLAQERIRVMDLNYIVKEEEIMNFKENNINKINEIKKELMLDKEKFKARFDSRIEFMSKEIEGLDETNINLRDKVLSLEEDVENYKRQIQYLITESLSRKERIMDIEKSTSWRISHPIRFIGRIVKEVKK